MCTLSKQQITAISDRLKHENISYSHLYDDLLDHICCDLECLMQEGESYSSAYNKVFNRIGLDGLKEIQEATIFYVKLNLIVMKKFMNLMAIIGGVLLTTGLIFKLNHWPGAGVLFFVSMIILLMGYFPTALLSLRKEFGTNLFSLNFMPYVIGFLVLIETGTAILFKIMHWPGGNILVIISMILIFAVLYPIIFYMIVKSEKNKIVNLALAFFSCFFLAITTITDLNTSKSYANLYRYEQVNEILNYYETALTYINDETVSKNSDFSNLSISYSNLKNTVDEFKRIIIGNKEDIYQVNKSYLHKSVFGSPYDYRIATLKNQINEYKNYALIVTKENKLLSEYINLTLDTQKKVFEKNWEERYFDVDHVGKYTSLTQILKDISGIQFRIIEYLNSTTAPEY